LTGGSLYSDEGCLALVAFPQTISAATKYYSLQSKTYTLSAKFSGNENANGVGLTLAVFIGDNSGQYIQVGPLADQAPDSATFPARQAGTTAVAAKQPFVNVLDYGAVGDGATNDNAAIVAAVASGVNLYFPAGLNFKNNTLVTLQGGQHAFSDGAKITGAGFIMQNYSRVYGFDFEASVSGDVAVSAGAQASQRGWSAFGNLFNGYNFACNIDRAFGTASHESWHIYDNEFTNNTQGIFCVRANKARIDGNDFNNPSTPGAQSILFFGGDSNVIRGNTVQGGILGINFIYHWELNGTIVGITNNVIADNTIQGITQESISCDFNGSGATSVATREFDTVASKSIPSGILHTVTLTAAGWASYAGSYVGAYMAFTSGKLNGQIFAITAQNHATFTLDMNYGEYALVAATDQVVIGMPTLHNTIAGNTIDASLSTTKAIYLYGFAYHNAVTGNAVRGSTALGGIAAGSVGGVVAASGSVTGVATNAPACNNTITGNAAWKAAISDVLVNYNSGAGTGYAPLGNLFSGNTTPRTYAVDTFRRANSSTTLGESESGQYWVAYNSCAIGITYQLAYLAANGTTAHNVAAVDTGVSDGVTVSMTKATAGSPGLAVRLSDGLNFLYTDGTALFSVVAGTPTSLGTLSTAAAVGDVLAVTLNGTSVACLVNGVSKLSVVTSVNQTATRHGLRFAASDTGWVANFQVA
jgi:hypothetical protein